MAHWQNDAVADRVFLAIREVNRGQYPSNIWQWRRVARHFGARLRFVPRELLSEPFLRHSPRVIYIPMVRRRDLLLRYLVHEITEAALLWEGVEPCVCPHVSRHEIAKTVEVWFRYGSGVECECQRCALRFQF